SAKMSMVSKPISLVMRIPKAVSRPDCAQAELMRPSFMGENLLGSGALILSRRRRGVQSRGGLIFPPRRGLPIIATLWRSGRTGGSLVGHLPDPNVFWYCLGAFVALVLGGIGLPPIPEEGVVVAAGVWAGTSPEYGVYRWLLLPVCVGGILCSDL